MFIEYSFVKECMSEFLNRFEEKKELPLAGFLYFYKDFVWKNKEIIDLVDHRAEFFQMRFMRVPTIYQISDDVRQLLNQELNENEEIVDQQRRHIVNMKQEDLSLKTEQSLGFSEHKYFDEEQFLYSQGSILQKLGNQPKTVAMHQGQSIKGRNQKFEKNEEQHLKVVEEDTNQEGKREEDEEHEHEHWE